MDTIGTLPRSAGNHRYNLREKLLMALKLRGSIGSTRPRRQQSNEQQFRAHRGWDSIRSVSYTFSMCQRGTRRLAAPKKEPTPSERSLEKNEIFDTPDRSHDQLRPHGSSCGQRTHSIDYIRYTQSTIPPARLACDDSHSVAAARRK